MMVKPLTSSPVLALALARAAHDEAARRMMKAAEYHLRAAARLDREIGDMDPKETKTRERV